MPPEVMDRQDAVPDGAAATPPWRGVRLRVPATEDGVRGFLETLPEGLAPLRLGEETLGDAQIVLAEVLNNVVEHALRDRIGETIGIEIGHRDSLLSMQVEDSGDPMPGERLPEKRIAEVDVDRMNLPEGGFGWFLIHELVEELNYSRKGDRNVIRISLRTG